ncbi:uncharacterized protein LOC126845753 [Adelges cooleyi]|uniref:uncharacterized protein LOC126845753 n=1 Tax=Adelges cooleyi TaxID=133065 RepID=UPI00217FEA6A|nr:uncharacterized protein LOC126845753 [Adelges cooleyi]XP_050440586.1 uncharacterized protein LOC126845753 [Adelges cooleyi]XP_050440587.1 uncharacterized protein LOC126845753 [Adelges cooleyi]
MCLSWIQACTAIHLLWSALYISVGAVQIVAGIFFLVTVPVLKIGSNIWTGSWNVFFGVGGAVFSCVGDWTTAKQRGLLSLTVTILIVNIINLIILEIAEWRYLTPESAKQIMSKRGMETLVAYARYTTSLSTLAGIIGSFLDSQITFCCMQRKDKTKQHIEPENNSDVDYIIPRVKSEGIIRQDSGAGIKAADADYGRSWVFEADATGAGNAYASTESLSDNARRPAAVCGSRTVTLKRKAKPVTPVVIVEVDGTGSRPAQLMTSFSRTPSPVGLSESSSQDSMITAGGCGVAAAPIYECLEKLTEPSVYRSRLNTALSVGTPDSPVDRPPPRSLSPKPPPAAEPVQYASLMEELQKTIGNRLSKHVESSDERFSAELDDVLKDIQELESPTGERSAERTDESSDSDAASMKTTRTVILNGKQHLDDLGYVSMRQDCAHLLSVYEQVDCRRIDGGGANVPPYPEETNNNTIGLDVTADRPSCKGWKALSTMLKRKHRAVLTLTPEIEASIVKSECLAYLSEKELVERYDRNKMVHRQIEERVWKKINGASETDSPC